MEISNNDLIKLLVNALRHDPDVLGIEVNERGWSTFQNIVEGVNSCSEYSISLEDLHNAISSANRGRLEIDGERVRAVEGHTNQNIHYKVAEPPNEIFYRTIPEKNVRQVEDLGLTSNTKKYIEVFQDYLDAQKDGKKRRVSKPVVISFDAHAAYHEGTLFYLHNDKWYVEALEGIHIKFPWDELEN